MNVDHININEKLLQLLKSKFKVEDVDFSFDIVYEEQVPNVCFIILDGNAVFLKKRKAVGKVPLNTIVGLKNILDKEPSPFTYKIEKGSKVIYLSRTAISQKCKDKANEIGNHLNKLLKEA